MVLNPDVQRRFAKLNYHHNFVDERSERDYSNGLTSIEKLIMLKIIEFLVVRKP
jgi:hypothetical protein